MSTQHPDNVRQPFFADNSVMHGDDEIKEAFYVFSHLKSREQLWDSEGKEVDNYVVKKLLTNYESYFRKHVLGKDRHLTVRVPNPDVEKNEAKILIEALESIPRNSDTSSLFYNQDIPPIFEIAVPMTTNSRSLIRISEYYRQHVAGKKNLTLLKGDIKIKDWIGDFRPEKLRVIPLLEDDKSILNSAKITEEFMDYDKVDDYQRVWLARSDPALNYGSLAAVLLLKTALVRLRKLQEKTSTQILPIIGCGSAPFRGNFKPTNVKENIRGYPSIHTYTIQSAFKYDYDERQVREAIEFMNETRPTRPIQIDAKRAQQIINKTAEKYQKEIKLLAPFINNLSKFIPSRRKRKLHIGLYGYSRSSKGVSLPRAITFCASLYSVGLPPELLGLSTLSQKDLDYIYEVYPSFESDMRDSMRYLNKDNMKYFPVTVRKDIEKASRIIPCDPDRKHKKITSFVMKNLKIQNFALVEEDIIRAASIRGFLG